MSSDVTLSRGSNSTPHLTPTHLLDRLVDEPVNRSNVQIIDISFDDGEDQGIFFYMKEAKLTLPYICHLYTSSDSLNLKITYAGSLVVAHVKDPLKKQSILWDSKCTFKLTLPLDPACHGCESIDSLSDTPIKLLLFSNNSLM